MATKNGLGKYNKLSTLSKEISYLVPPTDIYRNFAGKHKNSVKKYVVSPLFGIRFLQGRIGKMDSYFG